MNDSLGLSVLIATAFLAIMWLAAKLQELRERIERLERDKTTMGKRMYKSGQG